MPKAKKEKNELEKFIEKAMKKVKAEKETEIYRYIPDDSTGYIHHFKYSKIKQDSPEKICELINKYIIEPKEPKRLVQVRKKKEARTVDVKFSKKQVEEILESAIQTENTAIVKIIATERMLKSVRSELIASLYHNEPNHDLWKKYVLLLESLKDKDE